MRYFRTLTFSIILSVVAHVAIICLLLILEPKFISVPRKLTTVDLLEAPQLPRRPSQHAFDEKEFVRRADIPKELLSQKKLKDARFASEEEQQVLEEQRARQSGLTANRSSLASGGHGMNRQAKAKSSLKHGKINLKPASPLERIEEELRNSKDGDIAAGGANQEAKEKQEATAPDGSRPFNLPSFVGAEQGHSTIGEQIPDDVKYGDFTALNTDRHLYYSFYSRMEEAIRHRWVTYVRSIVMGIDNSVAPGTPDKENWTTKLEVLLDKNGNFEKAVLHEGSGSRNLDAAPVQAFRDAGQFPHPPQEMVKEDGFIHIYYAFTVNVSPRYAANRSNDADGEGDAR
jgi:TonB family protein